MAGKARGRRHTPLRGGDMITHAVVSVPDVVDRGLTESFQRPAPGPCCSFHVKGLLYGSLSDFALRPAPSTSTARVGLCVRYKYGHPE
jgi:hypothetical protein